MFKHPVYGVPSSITALLDTRTAGQSHLCRHLHTHTHTHTHTPGLLSCWSTAPWGLTESFLHPQKGFPLSDLSHLTRTQKAPDRDIWAKMWDVCMRNDSEGKATQAKRTKRRRRTVRRALRSRKGNQAGTEGRKVRRDKSCRVEWHKRRICFPLCVPRRDTFLLAMDCHRQKWRCKGGKLTSLRSSLEGERPQVKNWIHVLPW